MCYLVCRWFQHVIPTFYIPKRVEDDVKLSFKVSDKNGRENQTKTTWVWSGRHNKNGMGCGKRK